jgi:parallel beta-helix repeat protein
MILKKHVALYFLATIFLSLIISAVKVNVAALNRVIKVPEDYPSIQEAINKANVGDTIQVASGTYYERIVVNKSLTISGQNPATTIIDGANKGPIVNITVGNVKIENFTIRNANPYTAIWIENKTTVAPLPGITIVNNIIENNYMGIAVVRCTDIIVSNNTISNNQYGIRIYSSSFTRIINNKINSTLFYGIYIYSYSKNNLIQENKLLNSRYNILLEYSDNNTIRRNIISSSPSLSGYGLRLTTSCNTTILENTIKLNYRGIILYKNSINNQIFHNNFLNNTIQVEHYDTLITGNLWDTNIFPGAEGNYWSDYTGVDDGSGVGRLGEPRKAGDGIGDTLVPHLNVDWYPLMHPWGIGVEPIASFIIMPETPKVYENVTFDASKSYDPNGIIIKYEWDFGDGTPKLIEDDPVTYHVYAAAGNYTVTLTVYDNEGLSNSTSKLLKVLEFVLMIDVFTQKEPYSGRGPNLPSDAFAPQEEVILYAYVTYNYEPVAGKLVAFQVIDPNNNTVVYRENVTNETGYARVNFRILSNATFGIYTVISTVSVVNKIAEDTLTFKLGWIVEIIGIETVDLAGNVRVNFTKGEYVQFKFKIKNISFLPKNVTLTVTLFDVEATAIGTMAMIIQVDPGWSEFTTALSIKIPVWALCGQATAVTCAFTTWIQNGGIPYCPEAYYLFIINAKS